MHFLKELKMKLRISSITASLIGSALLFGLGLQAQTTFPANASYYVGYTNCSDSYATPTVSAPWCTFNNINGNIFSPGDHLYLEAGGSWNQELDLLGTGTSSNWITLSSYGSGANPIINRNDTSSGTLRCLRLTNPDYWSIDNLQVENAGAGILVEFSTPNHNGLSISNVYASGMQGIPFGTQQNADGIIVSSGIILTSPSNQNITLNPGQSDINNVYIEHFEGTNNYGSITLWDTGWGGWGAGGGANGTTTWALTNGVFQNLYVHQDLQGASQSPLSLSYTNHLTIMDSAITDPLGYSPTGTTAVLSDLDNNIVLINDQFTNVPYTGSNDGCGWDNELQNNGVQFEGDYFVNNAGAGIEVLAIHNAGDNGFNDYDSNNVVTSSLFVNNGAGATSGLSGGSGGAIWSVGNSTTPSGMASQNLFYAPGFGFSGVNLPGFTFTNNLPADSASDTWNAFNGFSNTQGQNQWSYQYWNGSSYSNMSTYNAFGTDGIWSSWGANSNSSLIWGSQMLPDACNTCWTARVWTAPHAGNISIRGWVAMDTSGGSGVKVDIDQHGSITANIMAPATLSGGNMAGFATNVDTTVAQGDTIYFQVNNGGSGNNAADTISWAPNIVYTTTLASSSSNLLNNPVFSRNLSGWNKSGNPTSAITEPNSGEVQMYDSSETYSLSIGQSVQVPSGTPFIASVSANTGYTSGAYLTVYDGVYATPLCTVALPSTNYPNWATYTCVGAADSTGVLFYSLGSGTSPAGAWVDFETPSLALGTNLLNNSMFSSSLNSWSEYGDQVPYITEPTSGEVQMYDPSETFSIAIGQFISVPNGTPFTASVVANTGYTSGAYMTVYDGEYTNPLCTVALPSTNYPNWTTYTCSGTADSTGVLFYSLGSGTSPAGAWADFETPALAVH
jgi:mannose-6-phosphate isomerase-like protein (cupin superfamily)